MTESIQFKKTQTQAEAVKAIANSSAKNFCLYGSSRSGKSFIIMRMILIRAAKDERSGIYQMGMSVPPIMMHKISRSIYNQWFRKTEGIKK